MGELIPLNKALQRLLELKNERRLVNKIEMTD